MMSGMLAGLRIAHLMHGSLFRGEFPLGEAKQSMGLATVGKMQAERPAGTFHPLIQKMAEDIEEALIIGTKRSLSGMKPVLPDHR
jgi:hypothetical protein